MIESELAKLITFYHEDKLSHAYLIETNNQAQAYEDLKKVIKNIICPNKDYQDECSKCNLCNLVDNNFLPSLIVIEATDSAFIKRNQIDDLKGRFSTIPTYTKVNIYVIKEAEKLNASSANALLKFLEEPDENILGFLITNNSNNVINTVKSRCEIMRVIYKDEKDNWEDNPYYQVTKDYLASILTSNSNDIIYCNRNNLLNYYTDKLDIINIFHLLLDLLRIAIKEKQVSQNQKYQQDFSFLLKKDIKELIHYEEIVSRYIDDLNYNVNIELFLDKFVIELSGLCGKSIWCNI